MSYFGGNSLGALTFRKDAILTKASAIQTTTAQAVPKTETERVCKYEKFAEGTTRSYTDSRGRERTLVWRCDRWSTKRAGEDVSTNPVYDPSTRTTADPSTGLPVVSDPATGAPVKPAGIFSNKILLYGGLAAGAGLVIWLVIRR